MAQPQSFVCADCVTSFESRQPNAKYCKVCRLIRNIRFLKKRTYKCWECEGRFAPLAREDAFCGECGTPAGVEGKCAFCERTGRRLLDEDIAVCTSCAHDPKQRVTLLLALRRKQDNRLADAI